MLLAHTTGIVDVTNHADLTDEIDALDDPALVDEIHRLEHAEAQVEPAVASADLLVGLAETHDRLFIPGSDHDYSNVNAQLAGLVIEQLAGRPLAEVLATRLIDPLGLSATTLAPADTTSPEFRGSTHDLSTGALVDPTDDLLAFGNGASGGLITTTAELLDLLTGIVHGRVLPDDLRDEMLDATHQSHGSYGLGVAHYPLACGDFVGHVGRVNGTATLAVVHRDRPDLGFVVAMNRTDGETRLVALAEAVLCSADTNSSP